MGDAQIGGLVGKNSGGTVSNCYSAGWIDAPDPNAGGLVGYSETYLGQWSPNYEASFWDSEVNLDINGIGNTSDPNVISETTENMQTESTFTDAGWDFVGEVVNGANDVWKMCSEPDYPMLAWEQCPPPDLAEAVEALFGTDSFKNEKMGNALLNKIEAVEKMIEKSNYSAAIAKLENDILAKTDGCANGGKPDKNDWVTNCDAQSEIYPLVLETINYVQGLMDS